MAEIYVTCPLCGKRLLQSDLFAHSPKCSTRSVAGDIKPGTCYLLPNGRIVRVMTVFGGSARYDAFDEATQRWEQSPTPIPVSMLKEPLACPIPNTNNAAVSDS